MSHDSSMSDSYDEITAPSILRAAAAATAAAANNTRAALSTSMPSLPHVSSVVIDSSSSTLPLEERYPITMHRFSRNNPNGASTSKPLSLDTQLATFKVLQGLHTLRAWITDNMLAPLASPTLYCNEREAQRIVAFNTNKGCGVESMLRMVCKELGVDMLTVDRDYYRPGMLREIVEYAAQNRCLVLFSHCQEWFIQQNYATHGKEWLVHMKLLRKRELRDAEMRANTASSSMFSSPRISMPGGQSWMVFTIGCLFQELHHDMADVLRLRFLSVGVLSTAEAMTVVSDYYTQRLMGLGYGNVEVLKRVLAQLMPHTERIAQYMDRRTPGYVIMLLEEARTRANQDADSKGATGRDLSRLPRAEQFERVLADYESAELANGISRLTTSASVPPSSHHHHRQHSMDQRYQSPQQQQQQHQQLPPTKRAAVKRAASTVYAFDGIITGNNHGTHPDVSTNVAQNSHAAASSSPPKVFPQPTSPSYYQHYEHEQEQHSGAAAAASSSIATTAATGINALPTMDQQQQRTFWKQNNDA